MGILHLKSKKMNFGKIRIEKTLKSVKNLNFLEKNQHLLIFFIFLNSHEVQARVFEAPTDIPTPFAVAKQASNDLTIAEEADRSAFRAQLSLDNVTQESVSFPASTKVCVSNLLNYFSCFCFFC